MEKIKDLSVQRMGTWIVKNMFEAGKLHNTIQEIKMIFITILAISEIKWSNLGTMKIGNKTY